MMHQRKSKKIFLYFLILLIVGSINNISLNDLNLYKIQNIEVSGLNEYENKKISQNIKNLNLKNILFLNENEIKNLINSYSVVENYYVFKKYPSTININIEKTKFFAKINYDNKIFLVGSNGKLTPNNSKYKYLPFIFGTPEIQDFLDFKKIIKQSKFSYEKIKNLYYFPTKRWDIKMKNNILIKLPSNLTTKTLDDIYDFIQNYNLDKMRVIDVRIRNQIILNE